MRFSLDVLRARKGDCLMLHYCSKDDPHLILIDGGPSDVYLPHLKPRLTKVHEARGLEEEDPLPVDVVMVSHVDGDHIKGLLELTKEQRGRPDLRLGVASLWHNNFDDLLTTRPKELKVEAGFGVASVGGGASEENGEPFDVGSVLARYGTAALAGEVEVEDETEFQAVQVLASIPQGRQLRDDAKVLRWKPNDKFKGKLILATDASKPVMLAGGLKLTVAGPMQPELLALQEAHDKWLRQQKEKKKQSPGVVPVAFVDKSIPNLSSIVVIAELGGKRMLLTGDARGDKILEGMELVGLLPAGSEMRVDVLKVPHHGSDNNMEPIFFERVTADHYVFSGDGEHGNPERATLEMLFGVRGTKGYTMHFTYPIDAIDEKRKKEWNKEREKQKKQKAKTGKDGEVEKEWSNEEHSLAALFEKHGLKENREYRVVPEKGAHVIDLLEPLGF